MKTILKFIYYFIIAFFLFTCSKEDDGGYENKLCAEITLVDSCDCVLNECDDGFQWGLILSEAEYNRIRNLLDNSEDSCVYVTVQFVNEISGYVKSLSNFSAHNCLPPIIL